MSLETTLAALVGPESDPVAAGYRLKEVADGDSAVVIEVLRYLAEHHEPLSQSDPAIIGTLLRIVHSKLAGGEDIQAALSALQPELIGGIDQALPTNVSNRHLLLQLLTQARSDDALKVLVERLIERPLDDWMQVGQVLGPLMSHNDWDIDALFPKLLECISEPSTAAPLLDLANYLYRSERVDPHPAAEMVTSLQELLGAVSRRLERFEEDPRSFGDDVPTVQKRLGEAVALAVSLCDSLACIGDATSVGKLNQTVTLKHRRVQCEAAGALAKLGDEEGRKRLIELADEPAARLRAIAYADELGIGEEIEDRLRSDESTAEAEMALWLSQPHQMGVPPTHVEVAANRRMLWPSFDDPVDVILVRFEYNTGSGLYSNIGLTGPGVSALSCDLADMPIDDIYAIYAGWHADHPDIFTVPANSQNEAQLRVMETFQQHLQHIGYEELKPQLLGLFLDERAGVFSAVREGTQCLVVTDGLETIDHATAGRHRPLAAEDIFNLYKGRKMLRTFNS
ncbi:HEAT repeat domain-containing protein [Roseiconus lacunae]|uniref:HEAT repeat domain-containing protein n=1 Tax=Roseiconus lacunae TaxID=2605694 RepID=UPI001E2CC170|nr:HEAT repeat domain-containing protein [Roseiconus lacunae]MCD0460620.1 HEAT repeat domain-containing protein [Roseiconus lacunae]